MTEFQALVANHDDRLTAKLGSPVSYGLARPANGTGYKARISRKVIVCAYINDRRTFGRTDETKELFGGDAVDGRHGASLLMSGTRYFGMSPRGEIAFPRPQNQPSETSCQDRGREGSIRIDSRRYLLQCPLHVETGRRVLIQQGFFPAQCCRLRPWRSNLALGGPAFSP